MPTMIGRVSTVLLVSVLLIPAVAFAPRPAGTPALAAGSALLPALPDGIEFGTLGSLAPRAAAARAAGVAGATLELDWSAYEPTRGGFSATYVAMIKERMRTFQAAGQRLTLALGVHYSPAWVRGLPDAVAKDQHGTALPGIDMVFSQPVRAAAAAYFARIDADLGLHNFAYVRLTSGGNAEMLYNTRGSYAAFSAAAQNGPTMAAGMTRNPRPGWRPGQRGITVPQVRQWANWYVDALAAVARWQMDQFDQLGFRGVYQAVTPGAGVRPGDYDDAVAKFLPDGLTGIGGVWQRFYGTLAGVPRLMTYVSSVADGSGGNDGCSPVDRQVAVASPTADRWSATRWQSRLADEYGFGKGGENPGFGDGLATLPYYGDTSDHGMLAIALRQASSCDFQVFNFAHDEQLWHGPLTLAVFAAIIKRN